jgi:hypothetical protein
MPLQRVISKLCGAILAISTRPFQELWLPIEVEDERWLGKVFWWSPGELPPAVAPRSQRTAPARDFGKAYWLYMLAGALFAAGLMSFELISYHPPRRTSRPSSGPL